MTSQRITEALVSATDTRRVVIDEGAHAQVGPVFAELFPGATAQIVADGTTFAIAGAQVLASLTAAGVPTAEPYVLPARPRPYAAYEGVAPIAALLEDRDTIALVVGSGTLNDLAKRASAERDRPYLVVATAASMDGYGAFGASLTLEGYKQTLSCPAPRAVVADLDVLVDAPADMTASGYGDLLGKVTAGADWMLADAAGVEAIDPHAFALVQQPLRASIAAPSALAAGDRAALEALVEGLIMSGIAMQVYAASRPSSGSEHQFSHLWEMEGLGRDLDPPLSHGFKVGLGSIAVAALYERLLTVDLTTLDRDRAVAAWPTFEELTASAHAAHPLLGDVAVDQLKAKYVDAEGLAHRLELLATAWPTLQGQLAAQLMGPAALADMLKAAGCPTTPQEIGLDVAAFKATYRRSQMIRARYTVLDVAAEFGILEDLVEDLFAPAGYWSGL